MHMEPTIKLENDVLKQLTRLSFSLKGEDVWPKLSAMVKSVSNQPAFLTHIKNVSLCNNRCLAGRSADCPSYVAKALTLRFLGYYRHDMCETLHEGSTH